VNWKDGETSLSTAGTVSDEDAEDQYPEGWEGDQA